MQVEEQSIVVTGSLAGVSRVPVLKYELKIHVFNNGKIDFELDGREKMQSGCPDWAMNFAFLEM